MVAIDNGYPIQPEQLERIHTKISTQTNRGVEIIKRLNKFAHTTDRSICSFDLNEVIQNLLEISQRFAELKRAPLSIEVRGVECQLNSSPFLVQQVIFYMLNHSFDISNRQDEIQLAIKSSNNLWIIEIVVPVGEVKVSENDWIQRASTIAEVLNGKIITEYLPDDKATIEFHITSLEV